MFTSRFKRAMFAQCLQFKHVANIKNKYNKKNTQKMEDWREKIQRGDIAEAARISGVSAYTCIRSRKLSVGEWTPSMIEVNSALKKIVIDREKKRAEFM